MRIAVRKIHCRRLPPAKLESPRYEKSSIREVTLSLKFTFGIVKFRYATETPFIIVPRAQSAITGVMPKRKAG